MSNDMVNDNFPSLLDGSSQKPRALRIHLASGKVLSGFLAGMGGVTGPNGTFTEIRYLLFAVLPEGTPEEKLHDSNLPGGPSLQNITVPWAGGRGIQLITDLGWSGTIIPVVSAGHS